MKMLLPNLKIPHAMLSHFSRVWSCATLRTISHQVPLSMGFSRQEYWSGLPFPSPKKKKICHGPYGKKTNSLAWLQGPPWYESHLSPKSHTCTLDLILHVLAIKNCFSVNRWAWQPTNPLQYSCLENPIDSGAWEATVHGVAKSQTRLSD